MDKERARLDIYQDYTELNISSSEKYINLLTYIGVYFLMALFEVTGLVETQACTKWMYCRVGFLKCS